MLWTSPIYDEALGSIGGATWGVAPHGRKYMRQRAGPRRSPTPRSAGARAGFRAAVHAWTEQLTPAQRDAWGVYASNVEVTDSLGRPQHLSGQQWFVGANSIRFRHGITLALDAPTTFDRYDDFAPTFEDLGTLPLTWRMGYPTNPWWAEDGGALLVYQSVAVNPSAARDPRAYRHAATVLGAPGGGPDPPKLFQAPYYVTRGQRVWMRYFYCRADGRYGPWATVVLDPV